MGDTATALLEESREKAKTLRFCLALRAIVRYCNAKLHVAMFCAFASC